MFKRLGGGNSPDAIPRALASKTRNPRYSFCLPSSSQRFRAKLIRVLEDLGVHVRDLYRRACRDARRDHVRLPGRLLPVENGMGWSGDMRDEARMYSQHLLIRRVEVGERLDLVMCKDDSGRQVLSR